MSFLLLCCAYLNHHLCVACRPRLTTSLHHVSQPGVRCNIYIIYYVFSFFLSSIFYELFETCCLCTQVRCCLAPAHKFGYRPRLTTSLHHVSQPGVRCNIYIIYYVFSLLNYFYIIDLNYWFILLG